MKLSGPMLVPKNEAAPRQVVVLLHGYGSDGEDLIGLGSYWRDLLPDAVFLAPNAPERCAISPSGYQWFPLDDDDRAAGRFAGAEVARPVLAEFLADVWAQTGLGPDATLLVGFSQGAMMALHVGLGMDPPPLGIVSFSGALIPPAGFPRAGGPRPCVCLVHGELDQVVDPGESERAAATLEDAGYEVSYRVEELTAHSIAPDGLKFAGEFIAELARG